MTGRPALDFVHATPESLVDQALAMMAHAKLQITNYDNDPQALEHAKTDLDTGGAMLIELRRRYANQRRAATR